jgi:hypothetical protein
LIAAGRAIYYKPVVGKVITRVLRAEEQEPTKDVTKPKRKYKRRDLVAED